MVAENVVSVTPATQEEQNAMEKFLSLIDGDPDLKVWKKYAEAANDRNLLLIGLRRMNLDYNAGFKTLKEFYRLATKAYPDLATQIDPDNVRKIIEKKMFRVLTRKEKEPILAFFKVGDWKPSQFRVEEISIAGALYGYATLLKWPDLQNEKTGVAVADIAGFKLKHARVATIPLARKALRFYNCTPASIRDENIKDFKGAAVAINSKSLFVKTYKMVKKVIPKDIRKFIHITKKDYSIIHQFIPKANLPAELGGTKADKDAWAQDLESIILNDKELWKLFKEARAQLIEKTKGIKPEVVDDEKEVLPGEGEEDEEEDKKLEALVDGEDEKEEEEEDDEDTKM